MDGHIIFGSQQEQKPPKSSISKNQSEKEKHKKHKRGYLKFIESNANKHEGRILAGTQSIKRKHKHKIKKTM